MSSLNKLFTILITMALIAGCATTARNLPEDYGSVTATNRLNINDFDITTIKLSCEEIAKELDVLESDYATQVQDITSKRTDNQVAGYIGAVFFLPALLATDNSTEAKRKIQNINKAKDELYKLQSYKKCSTYQQKTEK